jgi:hypothetical protein
MYTLFAVWHLQAFLVLIKLDGDPLVIDGKVS